MLIAVSSPAYRARARLRRLRRGSALAITITAALLLFIPGSSASSTAAESALAIAAQQPGATTRDSSTGQRVQEAARPLRDLLDGAKHYLPRVVVAILLLAGAAVVARLARPALHRVLRHWERAEAGTAIAIIGIWIVAIGAALSVIAGDVRALIGSVGLFGLALSWSLQAPIESFTGWLLNSFRGYYAVGDRISVGDVFGDVYAIDVLTTTVWEAGSPGKPVSAAQPTGALITFPNAEVLRSNIVNYTRDFPYVWDELTIGIAGDSDLSLALRVFSETAARELGEEMAARAKAYRGLLRERNLDYDVATEPQVFVAIRDAWTDLTIRYLVDARQRRAWSSRLAIALAHAVAAQGGRIRLAYPRHEVEIVKTSRE